MRSRHARLGTDDLAWIEYPPGAAQTRGLPEGERVRVIERLSPRELYVADQDGKQHRVAALHVVLWEFEVVPGEWRREDDPLTRTAIMAELGKLRGKSGDTPIDPERAATIERLAAILDRHNAQPRKARSDSEDDSELINARFDVKVWLLAKCSHSPNSDAESNKTVCDFARENFGLELVTSWNPSSCVFDARWEHLGRAADGLHRPTSSDTLEHARLLACANFTRMLSALEGNAGG